ncbi:fibronectin type III domain-containing protein, partial [Desulfobulbus sp. N3]|nr:fibronectin type III domain-containing protein [Desulfobulbus sp. N3]
SGLLLIGLTGCGYKNDPVAPQALVPAPINDLRYELTDKGAVLHWSYPTRTVGGEELTEIDSFMLYRAEVPTASYCDTCPIPFGSPIKVNGGLIPEREGRRAASYEIGLLRPAHKYFFKVRSRTGWLTPSVDSNQVNFTWETPPAVPQDLVAEVGDNMVALQWQAVSGYVDGSKADNIKYQVSRRKDKEAFQNVGSLLTESEFVDTEVSGGHEYTYRVQALSEYDDEDMVTGEFSKPLEVEVVDFIAPATPENVTTARTAASVKIFWDQGEEADLAGYRIYRRLGNEDDPSMIGEVKMPYNIYEDTEAPDENMYVYYSVSSFDKSDPANESERSADVEGDQLSRREGKDNLLTEPESVDTGELSKPLEVEAVDLIAPAIPENVATARTGASVKIFWDQGEEADLAGYRIYRRLGNEDDPVMIGEVKMPYNIYEDTEAPDENMYVYYSVSSFDKSDPPNESERSAEVEGE